MPGIRTARGRPRRRRGSRARRPAARLLLGVCCGLLASGLAAGRGAADPLDEARRCLEERAALEARRAEMLRAAEDLGRAIEAAERDDRGAVSGLRRRAERLQRDALDLELELLAIGEACQARAAEALPVCLDRLRLLDEALREGRAGPDEARELLRLRDLRGRLQAVSSEPAALGYPLLPPDSTDTQETLRAKLQYHEEVSSRLQGLLRRIETRSREIREERRTLVEASRFLEGLRFADEGGRVTAGGNAQFRGLPGTPGQAGEGAPRAVGGAETAGGEGSLELLLGWNPVTPEESDDLLRVLDRYRLAIGDEREAVERNLGEIRKRILPGVSSGR